MKKRLLICSGLFILVCTFAADFYWYGPGSFNGIFVTPKFGDPSNYATFSSTGNLRLYGNATVWEDIRIADGQIRAGATAPSLATFVGGGLRTYQFLASAVNEVEFTIQMPHSWKIGSTISPHIHWAPTSTDTNRVVWGFEYSWANIGSTFPSSTTVYTTNYAGGTAWKHTLSDFPDITNTNSFSSAIVCRLFRLGTATEDDYPDPAAFVEFDIHYEIDSLGTDQEYVK